MMTRTLAGDRCSAIRQMTVGARCRPRPPARNGDRDPAASTGDRTCQRTSSGERGDPARVGAGGQDGDHRHRHRRAYPRCGALQGGPSQADRKILRLTQSRAGFAALDAWLAAEPEPIERVVMESSGHYWMALAAHLRRSGVPVAVVTRSRALLCEKPARTHQVRSGRCPEPRRDGHARQPTSTRSSRRSRAAPVSSLRDDARYRTGEGLPEAVSPRRAWLPGASRAVRGSHMPNGASSPSSGSDSFGSDPTTNFDSG